MIKVLFNIIDSEIDHIARHDLFKGWTSKGKLDYQNNPNAYFDYEKFLASPANEWCKEQNMIFDIEDAEYAMRIAFLFVEDSDAMAFKLRWL